MQFKKGKIFTISAITILVLVNMPILTSSISASNGLDECYGFIIPVTGYQSNDLQMETSKIVNELLRNDIEVYWITNHIYVLSKTLDENSSVENNYFEKGSYIVPLVDNQSKNNNATSIVYNYKNNSIVGSYILNEPINNLQVYKLNEPKIAYHNGPWMINFLYFTTLIKGGFETYDFLSWDEISDKLNNEDYNVFIWGGGTGTWSGKHSFNTVKDHIKYHKAVSKVREFVGDGGGFVGSCYASLEICLCSRLPSYFPNIPSFFLSFSECRGFLAQPPPGIPSEISVEIVDSNSPISYGLPKVLKSDLAGGVVFLKSSGHTKPVAILKDIEESTTSPVRNLWMKFTIGKPIWVSIDFGKGKVVAFGDHPEAAQYTISSSRPDGLTQVGNHSRITYNAIFYAASEGPIDINFDNNLSMNELDIDTNGFVYDVNKPLNENNPPNKPKFYAYSSTIVKPNELILLIAQTEDPDGDLFYYKTYVGDNSGWDNYLDKDFIFASDQNLGLYYSYNKTGKYYMNVQAVDVHGAESEWSDAVEIIVTKHPFITKIFNR